jgi:hypothetical protein
MKRTLIWGTLMMAMVLTTFAVAALPATKTKTKAKKATVVRVAKVKANPFKFLGTIFKLFTPFIRRGYDTVEPNAFVGQPHKLPKKYLTPNKINVYSEVAPDADTLRDIDAMHGRIKRNTSGNFIDLLGTNEPETFMWNRVYDDPKKINVLLATKRGVSVFPAETPSIKGCPIIRTNNSVTGYASEVFDGVKFMWGGEVKPVFPFIVIAPLNAEERARPECVALLRDSAYHGFEHLYTVQKGKNGKQAFHIFTGVNDFHPIFKDIGTAEIRDASDGRYNPFRRVSLKSQPILNFHALK